MNIFGFIDSSGVIKQDRFFGVGLLLVKNVGGLSDKLSKNYQTTLNFVKSNKQAAITTLLTQGKKDEVISMLRNNKRFEMKFENIRPSTQINYERMIDLFFSDSENRFSAVIVDKDDPTYDSSLIHDSWEAYTGFSAGLTVREMGKMPTSRLCLILDEISKPKVKLNYLEDSFLNKVRKKIPNRVADGKSIKYTNIFGALNIESHSNLMLQLCDVLLGAIMYDFKKKYGIASEQTQLKKEDTVNHLREALSVSDLAVNFTKKTPLYFSVHQAKFKNNHL